MATKEVSTMVSDSVLDEVWLMMHMAAETGNQHSRPKTYPERKFIFEAEVEPDYLSEVVDTDCDKNADKEKALIVAAETLMQLGDDLNKQKQQEEEVNKLSKDIADYITEVMAPEIENKLGDKLSRTTATTLFAEAGVLNLVYGVFKKKVGDFVGLGQDLEHIALVSHITRGVAAGLEQSTSGVAGLLATVSTIFVKEKYGHLLCDKSSLVDIVKGAKQKQQQQQQ